MRYNATRLQLQSVLSGFVPPREISHHLVSDVCTAFRPNNLSRAQVYSIQYYAAYMYSTSRTTKSKNTNDERKMREREVRTFRLIHGIIV